jgi:hypothetical protein
VVSSSFTLYLPIGKEEKMIKGLKADYSPTLFFADEFGGIYYLKASLIAFFSKF